MTEQATSTEQTVYVDTPAGPQQLTLRYLPEYRLYVIFNAEGIMRGWFDEKKYEKNSRLFGATPEEARARAAAREGMTDAQT